ncbi:unnamed protein product [Cuscuta campestris]|uniref:Mal d 1-associated protein n=1 Tax=Cuscuta campestris TaxID=132261 RepID=A0A484LD49_9ASTE|nr:unnamed protein product [Cuscuta campestris]
MGWVWQDDDDGSRSSGSGVDINIGSGNPSRSPAADGGNFSTRKVVMTQCRTEESEPGKFIRKCEKTEQIFRDCAGRPSELVQTNKEYTEEDMTGQMTKGSLGHPMESSRAGPFLPGLRGDIEAMERNFFSGLDRFFDAAEQTMNGVFGSFGIPRTYDGNNNTRSFPAWRRRGVPVEEGNPSRKPSAEVSTSNGDIDFSGLTKDV